MATNFLTGDSKPTGYVLAVVRAESGGDGEYTQHPHLKVNPNVAINKSEIDVLLQIVRDGTITDKPLNIALGYVVDTPFVSAESSFDNTTWVHMEKAS